MQDNSYYPFGMAIGALCHSENFTPDNKYLYNDKEMQDDFGLEWYDYGTRFYDPQLGRWHVPDPMAEKLSSFSPYNYTLNNPIFFIDPDGMFFKGYDIDESNEFIQKDNDWYRGSSGDIVWQKGDAKSIEILGESYSNIGTTYSLTLNDGTTIKYEQNEPVEITENVLSENDWSSQMTTNSKGEVVKKEGEEGNCFFQSGEMVKKSGVTSKVGEVNNILNTQEGISYMDPQIDQGKSVRVHVDRNGDETGDHWVAISSRTTDIKTQTSKSFGFYDPGTLRSSSGTNKNNSFILKSGSLSGTTFYSGKTYIVKAIRKNY